MAEKLWDLANLITGFASAHALTLTIIMAKGEMRTLRGTTRHMAALTLTIFFAAAYVSAVVWCWLVGGALDGHKDIWRAVTGGRVIAVVLFTMVLVFTLVRHWLRERAEI